jgi:hypothetical protein
MSEKITGEDMSADDLRKRLEALIERTRASKVSSHLEREYAELAREAIERLESRVVVSMEGIRHEYTAKPLDCQGILYGGMGKIDVRECEVEGVDIREFTCRRA